MNNLINAIVFSVILINPIIALMACRILSDRAKFKLKIQLVFEYLHNQGLSIFSYIDYLLNCEYSDLEKRATPFIYSPENKRTFLRRIDIKFYNAKQSKNDLTPFYKNLYHIAIRDCLRKIDYEQEIINQNKNNETKTDCNTTALKKEDI